MGLEIHDPDGGPTMRLIGYTEQDQLILTPVNPDATYEDAIEARVYLCAHHLREGDHFQRIQ